MRFLLPFLLSASLVALTQSCSDGKDSKGKATRIINIRIQPNEASAEKFNLESVDPAYAGVGIYDGATMLTRAQLIVGDNPIEVPVGKTLTFRSALVSYPLDTAAPNYIYYSTAQTQRLITADTAEVALTFAPYEQLSRFNIYGLVHASATTPASGATIAVLEPFSGALVTVPGNAQIASTDAKGAFAFSYFYKSAATTTIEMMVKYGATEKMVSFPITVNNSFGATLPYINLSGASSDVKPQYSNTSDFDDDGTPNTAEFSLGTNPFSEMSGPAGIGVGVVVTNEAAGTNCAAAGQKLVFYRDANNNGVLDTGETVVSTSYVCGGASGAPGTSAGRKLAKSGTTTSIGTFAGTDEVTLPMLEIPAGYRFPLQKLSTTWAPLRVPLFFQNSDCTGTVWAKALGFGQGIYTYKDSFPYVLTSTETLDEPAYGAVYDNVGCRLNSPYLKKINTSADDYAFMLGASSSTGLFLAQDSSGGGLYKTNGTDAGTSKVVAMPVPTMSPSPGVGNAVVASGSALFFAGTDATYGKELWRTDGTAGGTTRLTDTYSGSASGEPRNLIVLGSYVYFVSYGAGGSSQLFRVSTSAASPVTAELISAAAGGGSYGINGLISTANGKIFFIGYYFDGSNNYSYAPIVHDPAGSTLTVVPGLPGYDCSNYNAYGVGAGSLFHFICQSNLYKTDGSTATSYVSSFNDAPLYAAGTSAFTYRCDGGYKEIFLANGTSLVQLTNSGASCSDSYLYGITKALSNYYFFIRTYNAGTYTCSLWKSDGTNVVSSPLKAMASQSCSLNDSIVSDSSGNIYFVMYADSSGYSLWKSDGTSAGTMAISAPYSPRFSGSNGLSVVNGNVIWSATDAQSGYRRIFRYNPASQYAIGDYGHGFSVATPLSAPLIGPSDQLTVVP